MQSDPFYESSLSFNKDLLGELLKIQQVIFTVTSLLWNWNQINDICIAVCQNQ